MIVTAGKINVSAYFYIVGDASHASPGDPITGLLFSDIETGGSASYVRQGAARVDLTLITLASASAAHSDGGFIEVDATNMPGVYRCDYADAAFTAGVDQVVLQLVAAAANNAAIAPILVDIDSILADTLPLGYLGSGGYGIYLDTNAANTNTVDGIDGTYHTPVSTPAAARTIADSIGVNKYYILGNSDVTLAATHEDWEFVGLGANTSNIIDLGSQDVDRSIFKNVCIEGTQGGTERIDAIGCALRDPGAGATTLHIHAVDCGIVDDITLDTSNDNVLVGCHSLVAGDNAPIVRASGSAGTISIRSMSGGVDLRDLSASHNMTLEQVGQVIFDVSNNVNANVTLRGIGSKTDNTAGMANLTEEAYINMSKINAEVDTAIADYAPSQAGDAMTLTATATSAQLIADIFNEVLNKATYNVGQSLGKMVRELGSWNAAEGVISGTPTTTSITTNITGYDDNFFRDQRLWAYNGATLAGQSRIVSSYNGTTGVCTFDEAFTSAHDSGDDVLISAPHIHTLTGVVEAVRAEMDSNSTQLAAAVALFTTQLTESYAADGAAPTPAQSLLFIQQLLSDFAIVGVTLTARKVDGVTTAFTLTLNDATNPTGATRAT